MLLGKRLARRRGAAQLEQRDLRRHEYPQRYTHHADSPAHVQLAVSLREVAHHVLRDQAPRRPADHGQIELAAVNVAREGEGDAARRGAVERAGAVREQDTERIPGWRCDSQRLVEIRFLRIVGAPVARVIDADQCERGAAALDYVHAVFHEDLARVFYAANDGILSGVAIVIAEDSDDAEGRGEVAERAHVGRNEGLGDVDHVARLHDQIGAERVRLFDDLPHLVLGHVDPGMHVREMRDADAVQPPNRPIAFARMYTATSPQNIQPRNCHAMNGAMYGTRLMA